MILYVAKRVLVWLMSLLALINTFSALEREREREGTELANFTVNASTPISEKGSLQTDLFLMKYKHPEFLMHKSSYSLNNHN